MRTWGTTYQQLNINAERQQFPHPQLSTPDKHVVKTFEVISFY
jgi:hypothetical protein